MSDFARKDFSTKAKEEITPDASKSTQERVKETVTDTTDRISRGVQPDDQKSTTQQAFDKSQRVSDREGHGSTPSLLAIR
uniref:Chaperone/heat shock protein n=1 Tax=Emericella nidulans TaxID=162425 RepID=O13341_EMEND|nr:chaperone/heat shock protein [Aspergillus nidulans]